MALRTVRSFSLVFLERHFMKIKDLIEKTGLPLNIQDIEVDVTGIIEDHFFNLKSVKDYRNKAIDYMVTNKLSFGSSCNSHHEIMKRFITVKCPVCGKEMTVTQGGGNSDTSTTTYTCADCKTVANLTMPNDGGVYFNFKG